VSSGLLPLSRGRIEVGVARPVAIRR